MEPVSKHKKGKRPDREGTYRFRTDGRWECRITLPNGKRKSLYGRTLEAVKSARRKAERNIEQGQDLSEPAQTVAAYLTRWLSDSVRPSVRPSTYDSYRGHVRNHLIPGLGRYKLDQLSPQHVQEFLNEKSGSGLSPRTVAYMRGVLRQALAQAQRWSLVSINAAQLTKAPRAVAKQVRPLNPEQVRALLDATKDDQLGPLFHVAVATGLRQGELLGLRWEDIDLDGRTLIVRYALQNRDGFPVLVEPKTEKSRRTLSLPDSAIRAFRTQRVRQMEDRLRAGERWRGNEWGLVFASTIGTPLNNSNVTHRFQMLLRQVHDRRIEYGFREDQGIPAEAPLSEIQAMELAAIQGDPRHPIHAAFGMPRQRFHDLRHCCASLLLAQNVSPRIVMEQLGHSQISLTMNTYSHVMPTALRQAADAIEAVLA